MYGSGIVTPNLGPIVRAHLKFNAERSTDIWLKNEKTYLWHSGFKLKQRYFLKRYQHQYSWRRKTEFCWSHYMKITAILFAVKSCDTVWVLSSTATRAAVANWKARDRSPDWINFVNSLFSPVVRFAAMSTRFSSPSVGSTTYHKIEADNSHSSMVKSTHWNGWLFSGSSDRGRLCR